MDPAVMARKLRHAIEMHDFGVQVLRERLRREDPEATPAAIEAKIRAWRDARARAAAATHPGRLHIPA